MKKVLILGAGMVVKPMVQYLLEKGMMVTVASRTKSKAEVMIGDNPNGVAIEWTVDKTDALDQMIENHDLVVSLLPYAHHVMVAKKCIAHKKNMVTTSYVKPEMQALDQAAKEADIVIINECGLDPGIDHMSAKRIIDTVHGLGGEIVEFYSLCGALPAPEGSRDNPFRYKFSWSPKGVVLAGNNDAKYLKRGKEIYTPTENLFKDTFTMKFPGVEELVVYPNRDSLPYVTTYDIPETTTMFRGTFRYTGWCESLDALKALKLTTQDEHDFTGMTYAQMMAKQIGARSADEIKQKVADHLKISVDSTPIKSMDFLGLFDAKPMNRKKDSTYEILSDLMIEKMMLGKNDRDMSVMQHVFLAKYPDGRREVIKSRLLDFGSPATDTSIARTVALPAACAVKMILDKEITVKGVHIPVIPEIYNPIMDELEGLGIEMVEEFGLPLSENVK